MKNNKIIIIALFAIGLGLVACDKAKETAITPVQQDESSIQTVPFFEVAKGDTISKGIFREKPAFDGDSVVVLYSSEDTKTAIPNAWGESSGSGFILDIKASVRDGNNAPATFDGYTKIPVDLNEGAGGQWIYLYYIKTSDAQRGYTELGVQTSSWYRLMSAGGGRSKLAISFGSGSWTDLNDGAGGYYIHLDGWAVYNNLNNGNTVLASQIGKSHSTNVIANIAVISSNSSLVGTPYYGTYYYQDWILVPTDLNKGAGGKYIYICYKTQYTTFAIH